MKIKKQNLYAWCFSVPRIRHQFIHCSMVQQIAYTHSHTYVMDYGIREYEKKTVEKSYIIITKNIYGTHTHRKVEWKWIYTWYVKTTIEHYMPIQSTKKNGCKNKLKMKKKSFTKKGNNISTHRNKNYIPKQRFYSLKRQTSHNKFCWWCFGGDGGDGNVNWET